MTRCRASTFLKQKLSRKREHVRLWPRSSPRHGSGQFIKDLREHFSKDDRVITSEIRDKDAIVGSIKDFLGKGN